MSFCRDQLLDEAHALEALLVSAEDKGNQISREGSAVDRNTVNEALSRTRAELNDVKKQIHDRKQSHLAILEDQKRLNEEVEAAVSGLTALEGIIKGRPLLSLEEDSPSSELEKHQVGIWVRFLSGGARRLLTYEIVCRG